MTEQVPKIKPLVWAHYTGMDYDCVAKSSVGDFYLYADSIGKWVVDGKAVFNTVEAAKAWCQVEYERRVRECLE
ncbi:hypothetical protein VN12_04295 [Pirellula sp. SH-Sr6A]|uniref:hypothetical protein n=1 Tax=Pirellula sp. SH-Sr6A TaxID=1632865 RepID=UPI00078D78B7|nr:hypothetical protein [Pirellula sp. SH-Sr6A]AMV31313.1 hypothetical protein VN12_04295 [Pirellula sp. SH-Sr6A]